MSLVVLKKELKEKKFNFGANVTIKKLKNGKLSKIYLSNDCKPSIEEELRHYKSLNNIEITKLDLNALDLGTMCKKQFPIAVLSY